MCRYEAYQDMPEEEADIVVVESGIHRLALLFGESTCMSLWTFCAKHARYHTRGTEVVSSSSTLSQNTP